MRAPTELVSLVFRNPDAIRRFSLGDWDRLVRQARQADLLARLHILLRQGGLDGEIPAVARWHFEVATALAECQATEIQMELRQLRTMLEGLCIPLVVLKGAAYVAAGLIAARGRHIDEIDLLVPRERLNEVESALKLADWHSVELPEYDQQYVHRWRHDAPSQQNLRRATLINVHHAILPDTAGFRPDTAKLRRSAAEVTGFAGLFVPSPEDRILHTSTLLFHDDELPRGLRDLSDLDLQLRQAATEADFWPRLLARAEEFELSRLLFYALRYTRHFFDTPVPDEVYDLLETAAPSRASLRLMDVIYIRMLAPNHHSCNDALTPLARHATYLRAHWLRMPAHLLLPHLFHKAFISPFQDSSPAKAS
ncbi:MAG: hypothetical protein GC183_02145 [Thiobacillus sp.]|nr:hypothetical protein [Thiobacillus sp.]